MTACGPAPVHPRIAQIAYVVDDIEAAARRHATLFGSGPFLDFGVFPMQAERDGERFDLHLHNAFGQWGDVQVELMRPVWDEGGFTSPLVARAMTCHHVAVFSDAPETLAEAFKNGGMPLEWVVSPPGTDLRAYFMDARSSLGHRVEIYAPSALVTGIYAMVREASEEPGDRTCIRQARLPA